ncbi:MAG TPA: hypothetical protein VG142_11945 [Trebonia sp.]|jgi:hypothetical protein|nr:hypothetical protein [Trebonia sp.]
MKLHIVPAVVAAGVIASTVACSSSAPAPSASTAATASAAASSAPAQPETAAAAKSAAEQFFALYSAGQWDAAWELLTPADQKEAPESVYEAVHVGCPSQAAGLAYDVQKVTLAGSTAVVTYTLSGAASSLGSATLAMSWTPAGWGIEPNQMDVYSHGSASADIAATKAAGECASS